MKKEPLLVIIERLKARLYSVELKNTYRVTEKAFSRNRVLSFALTVLTIVRGHKLSMAPQRATFQNGLNKVFKAARPVLGAELGALADVPTASAFSRARKKVKAEVFIELNRGLCQDYYALYGADQEVIKWHDQRVLG